MFRIMPKRLSKASITPRGLRVIRFPTLMLPMYNTCSFFRSQVNSFLYHARVISVPFMVYAIIYKQWFISGPRISSGIIGQRGILIL